MTSEVDEITKSDSGEGEDIRELDALAEAILSLRSGDELTRFLRDLCTRAELEALADRADASTTTVTRVSQWLHHGAGGYRLALDRTKAKKSSPGKAGKQ